jgi:adenylate cyclase
MLSEPSGHFFTVRYAAGDLGKRTEVIRISEEDEICRVLHGDDALFRHEIDLNPAFENSRDDLIATFQELDSELILPLKYEDEIRGIVSFGRKKSGKMFTLEDVDLLKTIVNQGAIAIENARLAEKMKQEESVRTNLARYLSPQVVEQVLHEDMEVNLGGARKTVTVLFSDIRKFTSITETRPPDELITILNEYFTEMARIIFEQQGSLDKYIGDAIVAVFGSLVEVENPAEHAVNAAIQMMELMPQLNKRWSERFDGFSMDIGIGINTGEVFLGNIGSPERMEFTVIGDTVNVASRFSDLAGPGEILITREVSRSLGGKIPLEEMSPSEVKGKSGELDVYRVIT